MEQLLYGSLAFKKTKLRSRPARHNYEMHRFREIGPMDPINFSKVAFYPVAHHRIANPLRYSTPKLTLLTFPAKHIQNERRSHAFLAFGINSLKLAAFAKALPPGKVMPARHRKVTESAHADKRLRPLRLRRRMTSRPPGVAIRARNP